MNGDLWRPICIFHGKRVVEHPADLRDRNIVLLAFILYLRLVPILQADAQRIGLRPWRMNVVLDLGTVRAVFGFVRIPHINPGMYNWHARALDILIVALEVRVVLEGDALLRYGLIEGESLNEFGYGFNCIRQRGRRHGDQ